MAAEHTLQFAHSPLIQNARQFIAKRRIPISILCFTGLIVFNLTVLDTRPCNPFALSLQSLLGTCLIVVGLAIRSWSAGTLRKFKELTTVGPYALVRNPLYVGSFLMMYGFAILMSDWLSILFIALPMSALYYSQVKIEERNLTAFYPSHWPEYAATTPRFIPTHLSRSIVNGWSIAQWAKNKEYQAILGAVVGLVGLMVFHFIWW
jgi:protein-S-isoprenylcysteine O-methyltransferase Ste14